MRSLFNPYSFSALEINDNILNEVSDKQDPKVKTTH